MNLQFELSGVFNYTLTARAPKQLDFQQSLGASRVGADGFGQRISDLATHSLAGGQLVANLLGANGLGQRISGYSPTLEEI